MESPGHSGSKLVLESSIPGLIAGNFRHHGITAYLVPEPPFTFVKQSLLSSSQSSLQRPKCVSIREAQCSEWPCYGLYDLFRMSDVLSMALFY